MRLCQGTLSHLLYWALRGVNWHLESNAWHFFGQIVCVAAGMWYWAMGQMALPGHKWLLSNKQDFPRNMAREAPSFLYECGLCFKDLLAASKSYLSGGSLALASKCFRSWNESVVQNTTCYGDGYTCSMEKKLHFWPMSLQIEFKSLDDSNREMDSLLETQQSFFVILKQKYGVFCFTCWQPQPTVGL